MQNNNRVRWSTFAIKSSMLFAGVLVFGLGLWAQSSVDLPANLAAPTDAIVINEVMASNRAGIVDGEGATSDWVELYNTSENSVSLNGFTLTDNLNQPQKWTLPSVALRPKAYLLIWLSGNPQGIGRLGALHASFKLNAAGEHLALYTPSGTLSDKVTLRQQYADIAYGRPEHDVGQWCFLNTSTPNGRNSSDCLEIAQPPILSKPTGLFRRPFQLTIEAASQADVHFTLDGSEPTRHSPKYDTTLTIDRNSVVRARSFQAGMLPSSSASAAYVMDLNHQLPVLSLVVDPEHLWNNISGIYATGPDSGNPNYLQRGGAWERPVFATLMTAEGLTEFSIEAGLRIYGGRSSQLAKKSFSLRFSDIYDPPSLNVKVFDEVDRNVFEMLLLRTEGGLRTDGHLMRDAILHELWMEAGHAGSAARPVFVYINEKPWGIYNLRERITPHFMANRFDIEDVDLIRMTDIAESGDLAHWKTTQAFFETQDLNASGNYEKLQTLIDIKSFSDHEIFQMYAANIDVVPFNMLKFRPRTPDGKWQWLLWDMDISFGISSKAPLTHDTVAFRTRSTPRPDLALIFGDEVDDEYWSTLLLRKLLEVEGFRIDFLNRFADLLNTTLHPSNVLLRINHHADQISHDMFWEMSVWKRTLGTLTTRWKQNVNTMRKFAEQRPDILRSQIMQHFNLVGLATLNLETPQLAGGRLEVNSLKLETFPWSGVYFQNVPISLKAVADDGYEFAGWGHPDMPNQTAITLPLTGDISLKPRFVRTTQ